MKFNPKINKDFKRMRTCKINLSVFIVLLLMVSYKAGMAQKSKLEAYIKTGLENNLALKEKRNNYTKSLLAINEAKGLFFPDINFHARYTIARGGRQIDFPVGDMLNPAYANLNGINSYLRNLGSYPSLPEYPQIENQSFNFYRDTEQETKLELIQPLFNPRISYNYQIKKEIAEIENADISLYKRKLISEIKTAYYDYLKTVEIKKLLKTSEKLVDENIRVNKSLFENDKVTIDKVYRAEAELSKLQQQMAEADKISKLAATWFNFLLNRKHNEIIEYDSLPSTGLPVNNFDSLSNRAISTREEIMQLEIYRNIANKRTKINKSALLPELAIVVDYGIQGINYQINNESDFMLTSLVLKWNIFKGLQNRSKIRQSEIEANNIALKLEQTKQKILLDVTNAFYSLQAAQKKAIAASAQYKSAQKAFEVVRKKYLQGQANLLEFIDARTDMTTSGQNEIIARFDVMIEMARLENIAAINQAF